MENEKKGLTEEQKKTIKKIVIGIAIGTGLWGLAIIPFVIAMARNFNSTGYSSFNDGTTKVMDNEVVEFVKNHSRLIDRLNPGKMVGMTLTSLDILGGHLQKPENDNWRFGFDGKGHEFISTNN